MAYSMFGTRGEVRFRTLGKRAGRGERGVVGKHERNRDRKQALDAERSFDFAKPKKSEGFFTKVRSFFARKSIKPRGNR